MTDTRKESAVERVWNRAVSERTTESINALVETVRAEHPAGGHVANCLCRNGCSPSFCRGVNHDLTGRHYVDYTDPRCRPEARDQKLYEANVGWFNEAKENKRLREARALEIAEARAQGAEKECRLRTHTGSCYAKKARAEVERLKKGGGDA